jgi:hypothetical protein
LRVWVASTCAQQRPAEAFLQLRSDRGIGNPSAELAIAFPSTAAAIHIAGFHPFTGKRLTSVLMVFEGHNGCSDTS